MDKMGGALKIADKVVPLWIGKGVFGEGEEHKPDETLPAVDVVEQIDKPREFPNVVVPASFPIPQINRERCKRMAEAVSVYGEPTYEGVRTGCPGVSAQDLIGIWTHHRKALLRSPSRYHKAVATLHGLWMRHLAQPKASFADMKRAFEQDTAFDPGPEGFELIKRHILDYVEKVVA